MKKILLFVMSMGFVFSSVYADESSLTDKIASMLKGGQSIKSVYADFQNSYSATELLSVMANVSTPDQMKNVLDIASRDAPILVGVLESVASVDSRVVRMNKPEHRSENASVQTHATDLASAANSFDPNTLPASSAGSEHSVSP
ncbi:MAG: hypothetical protein Q9M26_04715 [Mariprofundales bacterium]|nr:hypothetical protein [Mariprofundales bacterium]